VERSRRLLSDQKRLFGAVDAMHLRQDLPKAKNQGKGPDAVHASDSGE
jgi:hypothetical protein